MVANEKLTHVTDNITRRFFDMLAGFDHLNLQETVKSLRIVYYADAQKLHRNYLSHTIKKTTGQTVAYWLSKSIICVAKKALQEDQLSIKALALSLKFSNPAHFSKFFKNHTGLCPSDYRKQALRGRER